MLQHVDLDQWVTVSDQVMSRGKALLSKSEQGELTHLQEQMLLGLSEQERSDWIVLYDKAGLNRTSKQERKYASVLVRKALLSLPPDTRQRYRSIMDRAIAFGLNGQ